jgi:hypothetical protein
MSGYEMRRIVGVIAFLAVAPASANGRFPATTSVFFKPGDASTIYVGTTFGLVISHDDGQTWHWICESAVGQYGNMDPAYGVTSTGTIVAGSYGSTLPNGMPFGGLAVSRDGGCSWTFPSDLSGHWVSDLRVGADDAIWVTTANGTSANHLYVSRDDATSFQPAIINEPLAWWTSLRVAPSDPTRVYVGGYRLATHPDAAAGEPILYRSKDGGMSWQHLDLTYPVQTELRFLAVSPVNPDIVFARPTGTPEVVLRSEDGAATWAPVLSPPTTPMAVVALADGKHVLIGSALADMADFLSGDGGKSFAPTTQQPRIACAGQRGDGAVFACATNWQPDFEAVGRSSDGEAWSPAFRFDQIAGPLDCPAGSTEHDVCAPMFPALAMFFGLQAADAPTIPDAPAPPPKKNGCGCSIAPAFVLVLRRRFMTQSM